MDKIENNRVKFKRIANIRTNNAMKALRALAEFLERNPQAILRGKGGAGGAILRGKGGKE